MYQIRLNSNDSKRFKVLAKQMMLKNGLTVSDVSRLTGYSCRTIYNYFAADKDNRNSRFVAAALADTLEITVGAKK